MGYLWLFTLFITVWVQLYPRGSNLANKGNMRFNGGKIWEIYGIYLMCKDYSMWHCILNIQGRKKQYLFATYLSQICICFCDRISTPYRLSEKLYTISDSVSTLVHLKVYFFKNGLKMGRMYQFLGQFLGRKKRKLGENWECFLHF